MAQPVEHESCQRLVVALRHLEAGSVEDFVAVQPTVHQPLTRPLHGHEHGGRSIVLVADVADDLLQHVLEADPAGRAPVLVDHEGKGGTAPAHLDEQAGQLLGLGHHVGLAHHPGDRRDRPLLVAHREDVLGVDHAPDLVQIAVAHREPGEPGFDGQAGQVGERLVTRQVVEGGARHQGVGGRLVAESDGAGEQRERLGLDGPFFAGGADQQVELVEGPHRAQLLLGFETQ